MKDGCTVGSLERQMFFIYEVLKVLSFGERKKEGRKVGWGSQLIVIIKIKLSNKR